MTATKQTPGKLGVGGTVFLIVTLLLAAMTGFILLVPIDANNFEVTTELSWDAFSSSNPEAAEYLMREARLLAIGFLGLSLLTAVVAWDTFRADDRQLRRALWLFPLALLGSGLVLIAGDGGGLGAVYLVVGTIAGVALALAPRRTSRA